MPKFPYVRFTLDGIQTVPVPPRHGSAPAHLRRGRPLRRLLHLRDGEPDPAQHPHGGDRRLRPAAGPPLHRGHGAGPVRLAEDAPVRQPGGGGAGGGAAARLRGGGRPGARRCDHAGRVVGVRRDGRAGARSGGGQREQGHRHAGGAARSQAAPEGRSARAGDLLHLARGRGDRLHRGDPAQRAREGAEPDGAHRVHRRLRPARRVHDRGGGGLVAARAAAAVHGVVADPRADHVHVRHGLHDVQHPVRAVGDAAHLGADGAAGQSVVRRCGLLAPAAVAAGRDRPLAAARRLGERPAHRGVLPGRPARLPVPGAGGLVGPRLRGLPDLAPPPPGRPSGGTGLIQTRGPRKGARPARRDWVRRGRERGAWVPGRPAGPARSPGSWNARCWRRP
ncbi:hypothetical protein SGPA1_50050 [Streptomyces misionensis JCM 4497]